MTKSDYAAYTAFVSLAGLYSSLVGNGINNALVCFSAEHLSRTGRKPYSLYVFTLVGEIALFLPLLLVAFVFPTQIATVLLGNPNLADQMVICALFGLGSLMWATGRSVLQAEERFASYIWILWFRQGSVFLVLASLWFFKIMSFEWIVLVLTCLELVVGIGTVLYGIVGLGGLQHFGREQGLVNQFLSGSTWLMGYYLTLAIFSRMDVLMLSRFASEVELANYGVAQKYYSMALMILGSIHTVLRPKFSKPKMQQDRRRQREFLIEWFRNSVWTALPIAFFAIVGKPLFMLINGLQYERSFGVLVVLLVGVWLSLTLSPLVNILMGRKDFSFLFFLGVATLLVNVIATFIGVQKWGAMGAALALVLAHNVVLQVPILCRVVKR
jgi:O-antigen/teichoic acid export membrane protein